MRHVVRLRRPTLVPLDQQIARDQSQRNGRDRQDAGQAKRTDDQSGNRLFLRLGPDDLDDERRGSLGQQHVTSSVDQRPPAAAVVVTFFSDI